MASARYMFVLLCIIITCNGDNYSYNFDNCSCQLKGKIDGCSCNVDTVDRMNNIKIYPRLRSLLTKDYFRYYKVNLKRKCPFWSDDSKCAIRYCHVERCDENNVPYGIKFTSYRMDYIANNRCEYCEDNNVKELGYLNTSISDKLQDDFLKWKEFDDSLDNFCYIDDAHNDAEYVDLLLNPERYTGYKGTSANRIWNTIYMENCFNPFHGKNFVYTPDNMCLEKQVFYALISGLHASINIHLCADYLLTVSNGFSSINSEWGPNFKEFKERFVHEDGLNWLKNLYFIYLVELRSLKKVSSYLERENFYTGNPSEDVDTKLAVDDLLKIIDQFSGHFDESFMFVGDEKATEIKNEFKQHFRNISTIMDCVGCDKCKLWGKLQVQGLGTALKILFSGAFDHDNRPEQFIRFKHKHFQLKRIEIVALFNSIGRLSKSIYELDEFRKRLWR